MDDRRAVDGRGEDDGVAVPLPEAMLKMVVGWWVVASSMGA